MNADQITSRIYALLNLAQALKAGTITQDQYDEIRAVAS